MTEKVIALVGDLVGSRDIVNRVVFDEALLATMRERGQLNPTILSPYTLIGDEIQAVYASADYIFKDCAAILAAIHPEKMRFSFGVGDLVKPINPERATEMDGPAFHLARDGVDELKLGQRLLCVTGDNIPALELTRQSLFLVSHNMMKWNKTRLRTLSSLLDGHSVKEIAQVLRLSEQAIYKTIDAGALEIIINLFQEAASNINRSL